MSASESLLIYCIMSSPAQDWSWMFWVFRTPCLGTCQCRCWIGRKGSHVHAAAQATTITVAGCHRGQASLLVEDDKHEAVGGAHYRSNGSGTTSTVLVTPQQAEDLSTYSGGYHSESGWHFDGDEHRQVQKEDAGQWAYTWQHLCGRWSRMRGTTQTVGSFANGQREVNLRLNFFHPTSKKPKMISEFQSFNFVKKKIMT